MFLCEWLVLFTNVAPHKLLGDRDSDALGDCGYQVLREEAVGAEEVSATVKHQQALHIATEAV